LLMISFLLKVVQEIGIAPDPENAQNFIANIPQTIVLLLGNAVLIAGVLNVIRNQGRQARLEDEVGGFTRPDTLPSMPESAPAGD